MGAKSLWGLWAPDLLQYYDHIHQNKKQTCHLRMWDWFHIIHQILISSHFIQSNTLRAERWNIWTFCSRCPIGHSSVLVQAISHNLNKYWLSSMTAHGAGILSVTDPANERWRYRATPSLTDQFHIQEWSLMVLPGLNELRNDSIIYQLFNNFFEHSFRNSVLIPSLTIIFQMTAPLYFIPVLPRSVFTAGMWKWSAILVLYSWISLFLLTNCENIPGTFPQL